MKIKMFLMVIIGAFLVTSTIFANDNAIIKALGLELDRCKELVDERDTDIKRLKKLAESYKEANEHLEGLNNTLTQIKDRYAHLVKNLEKMAKKADNIIELNKENLELSQDSVKKLNAALEELQGKYNDAVNECIRPWYSNLKFYLGSMSGIVVGIIIAVLLL